MAEVVPTLNAPVPRDVQRNHPRFVREGTKKAKAGTRKQAASSTIHAL